MKRFFKRRKEKKGKFPFNKKKPETPHSTNVRLSDTSEAKAGGSKDAVATAPQINASVDAETTVHVTDATEPAAENDESKGLTEAKNDATDTLVSVAEADIESVRSSDSREPREPKEEEQEEPSADDDQPGDVSSKMKWLSEAFDDKTKEDDGKRQSSNTLIADRKKWIDDCNKKEFPASSAKHAAANKSSSLISNRMKWLASQSTKELPPSAIKTNLQDEIGSQTISDRLKSFDEKKHPASYYASSNKSTSEQASNALISDRLAWIETEKKKNKNGRFGKDEGKDEAVADSTLQSHGLVNDRLQWLKEEREKPVLVSKQDDSVQVGSQSNLVADRLKWLGVGDGEAATDKAAPPELGNELRMPSSTQDNDSTHVDETVSTLEQKDAVNGDSAEEK